MRNVILDAALFCLIFALTGCSGTEHIQSADWNTLKPERSLELEYADQFSVDYYKNGYALIEIADGNRFLLVPENAHPPSGLNPDITVLKQPLENIYLAATSAMDFFRVLDALDCIRLSGTDASGWYISEAKAAMEDGSILFAGKYSAPDYELIFSENCNLAVESTMIYHTPEVKEQLENLGIPVLVERSSYEKSPLGRMEWIKLYGLLLGRESEAEAQFLTACGAFDGTQKNTGKTVAFFSINQNGSVTVRKPGDYVSKMIEMAGGEYIFSNLSGEDNALSTMNMQMETFYSGAKSADIIIYNSTISGEINSIGELLEKNALLTDFKAIQEGNVWCTNKNLFQSTMGLGSMIKEIHCILTQEDPEGLVYLHRLE